MRLYKNLKMADNGIGFTQASGNFGQSAYTSRVVDSRFVGETENVGNPTTPAEKAYGRSLPFPEVADFPIRAYEFYDYHHELDNNTFVNYEDNATRKTGAISYLLFTSFGMSSNNTVSALEIHQRQAGVFPADRQPVEQRRLRQYGLQDLGVQRQGRHHHRCRQFLHRHAHGGIDVDEACEVKPTWNAAVCKGDIGRMNVGGGGGAIGFGGFGGGGAPGAGGPPVPVPREPQLPALAPQVPVQLPPAPRVLVLARARPGPLLRRLSLPLPQVVVESEVRVHLQGRQSFSAAMARSSPPTGKPTYERAPSTR